MKIKTTGLLPWIGLSLFMMIIGIERTEAQPADQDTVTSARIHSISLMLENGRPAANAWWYGWLAGYSVATIAQSAIAASSNTLKTRQDMILGAGTTLLGAAGQLLTPMVPGVAPLRLSGFPERTPEERSIKLKQAEALLQSSALREIEGRSWKAHAVCEAVNLGSGLITWLGFKRSIWDGLGNFALNTVISEAQIWSQPTRAIKDYRHYREKVNPALPVVSLKAEPTWYISAFATGISVRLVF
jgi:hypothetical protein